MRVMRIRATSRLARIVTRCDVFTIAIVVAVVVVVVVVVVVCVEHELCEHRIGTFVGQF